MVFSSFEFLFRFLPVFLLIYYIAPRKCRNLVLFTGSIVFYTIGEAQYVVLLLLSVIVNYLLAKQMYPRKDTGRGSRQKALLILALIYNFGILFFYKYSGLAKELPLVSAFIRFRS